MLTLQELSYPSGDDLVGTLMDKDGNLVLADIPLQDINLDVGDVVTAVLHQDPKTESLSILDFETAEAKVKRLSDALDEAVIEDASENVANLKERLKVSTTGHLTTLNETSNRIEDPLIDISETLEEYESLLATFGLGEPTVQVEGSIFIVDTIGRLLVVIPPEGPMFDIGYTDATVIRIFGSEADAGDLELGSQIESTYEHVTGEAHTIDVVFPSLRDDLVDSLLNQVSEGELEGTVFAVDAVPVPPIVDITLDSGETIILSTTQETRILVQEEPAEVEDLVPLLKVKVRYDPDTLEALEIETSVELIGEATLTGVLRAATKLGTSIPDNLGEGNILVATVEGQSLVLNVTEDTIFERAGIGLEPKFVSLFDGDIIRPTSRYNTATNEVEKLALRRPQLNGTLRGKTTTPAGNNILTISTDNLLLVTVTVSSTATITRDGEISSFEALQVGERIVSGGYDPIKLVASDLHVEPPGILRATGTLSDLDQVFFTMTVTPATGSPVQLLVPNKPGIIFTDDGLQASFTDLRIGDEVRIVFYTSDGVVLKIFVES